MVNTRRSASRTPEAAPQTSTPAQKQSSNLSTVIEREETPERNVQNNIGTVATPDAGDSTVKTPSTAPQPRPNAQEMHPSHFHSTAKKSAWERGKPVAAAIPETPSKIPNPNNGSKSAPRPSVAANPFSSPSFDFRAKRPSIELSSDTQKIMEEVRQQAARIKGELRTRLEEQEQKDGEAESSLGGRKIAKPKGQIGRFSDLHMAQFKKMDSIANHPSAFRADPNRFSPTEKSLKRTHSKTDIDKSDSAIPRPPHAVPVTKDEKTEEPATPAKRLKKQPQPSTPVSTGGKSNIPTSASSVSLTPKTTLPRPSSTQNLGKAPNSMIPSLARSPSNKSLTGSTPKVHIEVNVPQSEATNKFRRGFSSKIGGIKGILRNPKPRFSNDPVKIAAGTHIPKPKAAEKELKETVATTTPEANKTRSGTSHETPRSPSHRREKHVNFSASPTEVIKDDATTDSQWAEDADVSPSPVKKPVAAAPSNVSATVSYPNLKDASEDLKPAAGGNTAPAKAGNNKQTRASIATMGPSDFTFRSESPVKFFSPQPNRTTGGVSQAQLESPLQRQPQFVGSTSPTKPNNNKPKLIPKTPTIRPVRASGAGNAIVASATPKTKDDTSAAVTPGKSSQPAVGGISHGLSNKKRKRDPNEQDGRDTITVSAADIDQHNKENTEPVDAKQTETADVNAATPTAKKVKLTYTSATTASSVKKNAPATPKTTTPVKKANATPSKSAGPAAASRLGTPSSRIGTPTRGTPSAASSAKKGKSVLSLSRLSRLAMPKGRN